MKKFIIAALMCIFCFACISTRASDTSPGTAHKFTIEKICTDLSPAILVVTLDVSALPVSIASAEVVTGKTVTVNALKTVVVNAAEEKFVKANLITLPHRPSWSQRTYYYDYVFYRNTNYRSKNFSIPRLIPYSRDRS